MFGNIFKRWVLASISGWFCVLLVAALLIHPFELSAEQRLWQADDLTYHSPVTLPDLVATPAEAHGADPALSDSPLFGALPCLTLPHPEQSARPFCRADAAGLLPTPILAAPSLPRPPPARLDHPCIA